MPPSVLIINILVCLKMWLLSANLVPPVLDTKELTSLNAELNELSTLAQDPLLVDNLVKFIKLLKEQLTDVKKIADDIDDTLDILAKNNQINADMALNATELIKKHNYPVELYEVETSDGYVITIIRIPNSGRPVLLNHGLMGCTDDFITSGPDDGLAYLLADCKYDVWMPNARGNKYSRKHIHMSPDDKEFWDFTWHEIGVLDLPRIIDFILEKVSQTKLYYIGFSQGTTVSFVLLSEKPEYNDKIILLVSLAPVAYISHIVSPLVRVLALFKDEVYFLTKTIGYYEFLPNNEFTKLLKLLLCGTSVLAATVCSTVVSLIMGFNYDQVNGTDYPIQFNHIPSGSATKQLIHYFQEIHSGNFQQFDCGKKENVLRYGRITPSQYNLKAITAKVALIYSDNDWISDRNDVLRLAEELSNVILVHKLPLPFNHLDYLWAKDGKELIFQPIFELFKKYN